MSFFRAHYFHRNILPSRQISFLQPPKIALGKSNSHFLRLSQLKSFTKSVSTSSSSLQEGINPIFTAYPFITFFSSLMLTFENGNQPKVEISHSKYLSRSEMIDQLKNIFNPHEDQSFYHIIYGINGIGKSTLVKTASKEVGQGVIYVEIPASVYDLNEAFAKALNMSPNKFTFTNRIARSFLEGSKEPELKQYLEAIKYGAEVYKRKHGKPPVIIYDNVDHLVAKHSKILDLLQNDAKKSADDKKYITVFVSGKNSTFNKMYSNKHIWPHAKKLVMEIGELSKEESMNYLVNKRGIKTIKEGRIDTTEAEKLYELVGGNIRDLSNVADKFNASFEGKFNNNLY
uniref:ATPase domain-containing protein n=1 Tax=Rhizophagus irregularis (strain DAOM 181602 / DAOM 197198 / MUCL 43194) TaxID=747089 RepID=U9TBV2_RHIID